MATLSDEPDSPNTRQLALITGLDDKTIRRGRAEFEAELSTVPTERQRRAGDILLLSRGLNALEYAAGRGFYSKAIEGSLLT